ncbi:MAG TPA: Sua5/YciO/YrdC/YwlC family protein, partial [Acidimicrobiales bacterium]|nr:Sua5/YciO/YrdC/YwlC family protein [Acidimicrobiales bacterium]
TTSANRHQEPPLTTAREVHEHLGAEVTLVLDGGPCLGQPSTVVDCTGEPRILRQGSLGAAEIAAALA